MEKSNDTILTYPYKDYTWRLQKMSFLAGLEGIVCLTITLNSSWVTSQEVKWAHMRRAYGFMSSHNFKHLLKALTSPTLLSDSPGDFRGIVYPSPVVRSNLGQPGCCGPGDLSSNQVIEGASPLVLTDHLFTVLMWGFLASWRHKAGRGGGGGGEPRCFKCVKSSY